MVILGEYAPLKIRHAHAETRVLKTLATRVLKKCLEPLACRGAF